MDELLSSLARLVPVVVDPVVSRFQSGDSLGTSTKNDGSLLTEVDRQIQSDLVQILSGLLPGSQVLAEEQSREENAQLLRNNTDSLWLVDPLDGTTNFVAGIPYFAVSVALLQEGEVSHALVYDPMRKEIFTASRGAGAYLNGEPINTENREAVQTLADCVAIVDLKRLSTDLACRIAAQAPFRSQRSFGSVALDWCWLAAGRGDIYLHGRQQIWDYAAGNLVARESGIVCSQLDGTPIVYNELGPLAAIAAQNETLFKSWSEWLNA